jgi:DedD protein
VNEHVRNRVVGGIILASLAAIFLPMLLDGAGIERRSVPAMPDGDPGPRTPLEPVDPAADDWAFVEEAARRRERPDGGVDGRPLSAPEPAVEPAAEPSPRLDDDGLPVAWSVQLGSFEEEENARGLRARLTDDGHEAYVDRIEREAGPLWRVAVGPRVDAAAAERLAAELGERYGLEAIVVRFSLADPSAD